MKIIEAIKDLRGLPATIPNSTRDDLPEFFKDMGYKTGAEIGVYKGEFTKKFLDAELKMYGVDPWAPFRGQGRSQTIKERQDFLYGHAKRYLEEYIKTGQCQLIRKKSIDALDDFKNESLDFVYIDGDHRFRYIAEDIYEWIWKVKKGGVISGHDYFCSDPTQNNMVSHVGAVVDAYVKALGIGNFYITESDKWNSWLWIRQ